MEASHGHLPQYERYLLECSLKVKSIKRFAPSVECLWEPLKLSDAGTGYFAIDLLRDRKTGSVRCIFRHHEATEPIAVHVIHRQTKLLQTCERTLAFWVKEQDHNKVNETCFMVEFVDYKSMNEFEKVYRYHQLLGAELN